MIELYFILYQKSSWTFSDGIASYCLDYVRKFPGHFPIESLIPQKTYSFPTFKTEFAAGRAISAILYSNSQEIPEYNQDILRLFYFRNMAPFNHGNPIDLNLW